MQPTVMAFATFLKLLSQTAGERIRDLEKYATPGGYDFWRPLREGIDEKSVHGLSDDFVLKGIEQKSAQNQAPRNQAVFSSVSIWLEKQKGKGGIPPKGVWKSPNGVFTIRVEPEISLLQNSGNSLVIAIYGRKEPRISRDDAGAALLVLKQSLGDVAGRTYGILDAGSESESARLTKTGTNVSEQVLSTAVVMIEAQLLKVKGY